MEHALWERLIEVPFENKVPEDKQDPFLKDKLWHERSGILNWALAGSKRYFQHGMTIPTKMRQATTAARDENDSVRPFVDECVQTKVGGRVSPNDLFLHYKYWCSRNGHDALSIKDVKRDLEDRFGFQQKRKSTLRFWADVELVSEELH